MFVFVKPDEVQRLDGIESVCGRAVELLPVRRTAGRCCDGHIQEPLQHQCVLHIHRQCYDRARQRNVEVRRIGIINKVVRLFYTHIIDNK